jgi:hypothetical protein
MRAGSTEGQFFKRTVIGAAALTLVVWAVDSVLPHDPIPVAPFGEPWLTIVGGVGIWVGLVAISHVARWIYLIVTGREANLGD